MWLLPWSLSCSCLFMFLRNITFDQSKPPLTMRQILAGAFILCNSPLPLQPSVEQDVSPVRSSHSLISSNFLNSKLLLHQFFIRTWFLSLAEDFQPGSCPRLTCYVTTIRCWTFKAQARHHFHATNDSLFGVSSFSTLFHHHFRHERFTVRRIIIFNSFSSASPRTIHCSAHHHFRHERFTVRCIIIWHFQLFCRSSLLSRPSLPPSALQPRLRGASHLQRLRAAITASSATTRQSRVATAPHHPRLSVSALFLSSSSRVLFLLQSTSVAMPDFFRACLIANDKRLWTHWTVHTLYYHVSNFIPL